MAGENDTVEYKERIARELAGVFVAFANARGGTCLIGVRDAIDSRGAHVGEICGVEVSDRSRGQIQSKADSTLDRIPIEIESESDDAGRGIYIVRVPEGRDKPYCTGGGRYLVRRNGQNSAISPTMMVQFLESRIQSAPATVPFVHVSVISVEVAPSLKAKMARGEAEALALSREDLLRGQLQVTLDLANLGAVAAQSLIVDVEVHFKVRRPFGCDWLPADTPSRAAYLGANPDGSAAARRQVKICLRKHLFAETVQDFFEGRQNWPGLPFLPDTMTFEDRSLWPSPMLVIRCLYRDLHGQHFESRCQSFFHLWPDREHDCISGYLLGVDGTEDHRVERLTSRDYADRIPQTRHLRYAAFYGTEFPAGELLLLRAAKEDDPDSPGDDS